MVVYVYGIYIYIYIYGIYSIYIYTPGVHLIYPERNISLAYLLDPPTASGILLCSLELCGSVESGKVSMLAQSCQRSHDIVH